MATPWDKEIKSKKRPERADETFSTDNQQTFCFCKARHGFVNRASVCKPMVAE
jgi:hypothetical protein